MSYSLLIDESGDGGLENRDLRHRLFFMGACLIKDSDKPLLLSALNNIKIKVDKKNLHLTEIRQHNKLVYIYEQLAKLPIKCFGLVSDKDQLGFYELEAKKKDRFYNKNFEYLLECVGEFCIQNNITVSSIIPEERRTHNYAQLIRYLVCVRDDKKAIRKSLSYNENYYHRADNLKVFEFENTFSPTKKNDEPLLQIADALCYALNKLFVPDNLGIIEYRYFHEIRKLIYSNKKEIIGYGLTPVMDFSGMHLAPRTETYLNFLKNFKS